MSCLFKLLQGAALKLALTAASQAIVKFCLLVSCGLFQVLLVAVVVMRVNGFALTSSGEVG